MLLNQSFRYGHIHRGAVFKFEREVEVGADGVKAGQLGVQNIENYERVNRVRYQEFTRGPGTDNRGCWGGKRYYWEGAPPHQTTHQHTHAYDILLNVYGHTDGQTVPCYNSMFLNCAYTQS